MRKTLLSAAIALAVVTSNGHAADLQAGEYDWTGISIGLVGSTNDGKDIWDEDFTLERSEFLGGFAGYDQQFGQFVLGGRVTGQLGSMNEDEYAAFEYKGFYDFNARLGVAIDRALIYSTGGYSISDIEEDGESYTRGGFNIGGGFDYAVNDSVVVGAEYVYRSFDANCEPHGDPLEQQVHSVQAHIAFKF